MDCEHSLQAITSDVYLFEDTCNVYVIKYGDACILIDFGSGEVLKHLESIGVDKVIQILHTHHHREQCQGDAIAVQMGIRIAVPKKEAWLFKDAQHYWNHLFQREGHVLGAPYVRPPRTNIPVQRELEAGDTIDFGNHSLTVIDTPGNSEGSISFQLVTNDRHIIFVGDLLMHNGKLINLYDAEWDYGYCSGLKAIAASCRKLESLSPEFLLPSHGAVISNGTETCRLTALRVANMVEHEYLRDWTDSKDEIFESSVTTTPTIIPEVDVISPHLLRWKGTFGSLYLLLSDEGSAVMIDAGIILYQDPNREAFFQSKIDSLMRHYGIRNLEAVLLTHYHGDHLDIYPFLHRTYGTQLWCFESMVEIIECPERFNLMALVPSYGVTERISVDRVLHEAQCVEWKSYRFSIFHLPGQTYYAMGISCVIDDVFTVFAGDNVFYSRDGSGHDAFALRNKAILEEGYLKCAQTLLELKPERILSGHTVGIDAPEDQIKRFYEWAKRFRHTLESFSPYENYEWMVDPYWLEFYPFQSIVHVHQERISLSIKLRNHHAHSTTMSGTICGPEGWGFTPPQFHTEIAPKSEAVLEFFIDIPEPRAVGRYPITADVTLGDHRLGELFDAVVEIRA